MTKSKQKTLNGKNAPDIMSKLEGINERVIAIEHMLWEFLGSKQPVSSSGTNFPSSSGPKAEEPSPVSKELPSELLPYVTKESETAYHVTDPSVLEPNPKRPGLMNLKYDLYKLLRPAGWAFAPARKNLIFKPKEMKPST